MNAKLQIKKGQKLGSHCPECRDGEQIIRQNSHTDEFFVSCTRYPDCRWSANLPESMRLRALGARGLFDEA